MLLIVELRGIMLLILLLDSEAEYVVLAPCLRKPCWIDCNLNVRVSEVEVINVFIRQRGRSL